MNTRVLVCRIHHPLDDSWWMFGVTDGQKGWFGLLTKGSDSASKMSSYPTFEECDDEFINRLKRHMGYGFVLDGQVEFSVPPLTGASDWLDWVDFIFAKAYNRIHKPVRVVYA